MTPTFKILAGGNDITADISSRLIALDLTDSTDEQSDKLSLTLDDSSNTLALPRSGAKLEVFLGYNGNNERVGSFIVDEVSVSGPPNVVTVEGSSSLFVNDRNGTGKSSFSSHQSRSFEGKTIQQIVETVAAECGMTAVVDSALAKITVPHIAQVDESSANLLVRIARRYGGILKPADGRLVMASESGGKTTSGAALTATLTPSQVTTWSSKQGGKLLGKTKVKSKSHNYNTGEVDEYEEEVPDSEFGE